MTSEVQRMWVIQSNETPGALGVINISLLKNTTSEQRLIRLLLWAEARAAPPEEGGQEWSYVFFEESKTSEDRGIRLCEHTPRQCSWLI